MNLNLNDRSTRKLRHALVGNAAFSGLSAALILLSEPTVTAWLGLEGISIQPVGLMLAVFAIYLLWMSRWSRVPVPLVLGVIVGDWLWVAGTAVVLTLASGMLSAFGKFLLLDVAVVVAIFALWQTHGLKVARAHPA